MAKKKTKEIQAWVWVAIILGILLIVGIYIYSASFEGKEDNDIKSGFDSGYESGYNYGRDLVTDGKSSRDTTLCKNQCDLTNNVCVAFMSNGMEWRDCGTNCNCNQILTQCYNECEELFR